ncbi:polysaccharide deacetylase [Necator americanus]|uniref:Polysaccharide deacetylase n=1 Tax=Necator americanus TaxID=51031 RepID=W2TXP3_NECAM|nr:polysaccharide deacetylase [Necator americanus]ETN86638.1 polysaccharide deacetylase [Necator americanus]
MARAGVATLRPDKWKGGARVAVALSFDSDHETNELRDGGGSVNRLSWGQYGNRVGVPRILSLLEKYSVPVSFYVPAVSALLYPDEQRRIVDAGHEIGVHGWIHELNSKLEFADERDLLGRSMDTLEKITGKRPTGFRSPSGDFSKNTLQILQELGFAYDSSLGADDDCYELEMDGEPTGLVEIPFDWGLRPYTPPSDVFDIFRRELEAAYAEGGLFELTMHPHVALYVPAAARPAARRLKRIADATEDASRGMGQSPRAGRVRRTDSAAGWVESGDTVSVP